MSLLVKVQLVQARSGLINAMITDGSLSNVPLLGLLLNGLLLVLSSRQPLL